MGVLMWTVIWLVVGAFFVRAPLLAIPLAFVIWRVWA